MRILLIEDNRDHRDIIFHALTDHAPTWQIDWVRSGEEALRQLKQQEPYNLVFLDYSLPQQNGLDLLKKIRHFSSPPPVVMVTGYGDEQTAVKAMKIGAYDYVVKSEGYWRRLPAIAQRAVDSHQLAMEHTQMEQALRNSEERLRKMVEGTQALLINVNNRGRITYVNDAAAKTLELSPEEILGKHYLRFVHPDDRAWVNDFYNEQLDAQTPSTTLEFRIISASGDIRWVNFLAHPILKNNQVVGQTGIALDVTQRKQMEEALKESEERYRSLFEDSPLSLWVEDFSAVKAHIDELRATGVEDFRSYFEDHPESVAHCVSLVEIIDVNRATLELFEADDQKQLLKSLDTIFTEETYPAFKEELIAIAEGKIQFQVETVNQTLKGHQLHLVMKWQVTPGHESSFSRVQISLVDITERKRAEEELRKLAATVEMAPDDIAITDLEGRIIYANPAFARLHQLNSEEEAIGTNAFDWFLYPDKALAAMQETMEKGSITNREFIVLTKDNEHIPVEMSATVLKNDRGDLRGFAAVSRDITERKQAEEALQRHDAILEAVNFAAQQFLETGSWRDHIQKVLSRLRRATNASRVCVFENQVAEDCTVLTSLRYEWTAPEIQSQMDNPTLQNLSFQEEGLARWEEALSQGRIIHGFTRTFPENERTILSALNILSIIIVPIFVETTWWGNICIEECLTERDWSLAEQDALRTAARALGAAIKGERTEKRLHQRNQTLYQTGQKIVSSLEPEQVINGSLEGVRNLFQAKACSLWLIDSQTDELVCQKAVGLDGETVTGWRLAPGQGIAGWVLERQEGLIIPDTREDPRHYEGVSNAINWNVRSLLAAPLQVKKRPLGVIEAVDERPKHFDSDDLGLLESLTAMIAIALENAKLYDQTQKQAETNALLLREVNHRVKNNLIAIEGMLHVERRYIKRSQKQRNYQTLLNDLINRIKGLSVVHQLLSASKWSSLPLSKLVKKITDTALQTLPPNRDVLVNISTTTPIKVSAQQAHNLAIVINELTTNVAKYATEPDETTPFTICINLETDNETVCMEFRDAGPGFPEDVLHSERQGTGLYLVRNTVRRNLRGEVTLHNDDGAVITIRFAKTADEP